MTEVQVVQDPPALSLHQKIACVIGEVHNAKPQPSGHNQYGREAFSIEDVEGLVAPHLASYRVTIEPSMLGLNPLDKGLWQAVMDFVVRDADNPEDMFTAQWMDIGSNPAAAVSFAAKAYYKRLFHIADSEEDSLTPEPQSGTTRGSGQRTAASRRLDASPMPDGREATASEPDPTPPKGRNVIALQRPVAAVDPEERAECLQAAIELAKAGQISGAPIEDEAEAMVEARTYLDRVARKNYKHDFMSCTSVQVAGIHSLITTKLRSRRA